MSDSPPGHPEIDRIVAPNQVTLEGTNTYVVAAGDGAFVIDPRPADEAHAAAVLAAADARAGSRASCSPTRTRIIPRRVAARRGAASVG